MSTSALANLFCATCNDTRMHERNVCRRCGTTNHSSGNAPVPRPARAYGYATMKAIHYDAAIEQAAARRRARAARHQQLSRGVSKP